MCLNYRGIARVVSVLASVLGFAMLPPALVGLFYNEIYMTRVFAITAATLITLGTILVKKIKPSTSYFKIRDGFLVVISCWIFSGFLGAVPYYFSGFCPDIFKCIFESFSGFTTTGATTFRDVEILPKALLFWRSFSQWIGGFGILFIPIALLPALSVKGHSIVRAEMSGTKVNKVSAKLSDTARKILLMLTVLTLAETLLLMLGGLNFFDALTHSFTTLSTGGFSNYNTNVGHFESTYIYLVFSVFMLIAGTDVTFQYNLFTGNFKKALREFEPVVYLILFAICTLLLGSYLLFSGASVGIYSTFSRSAFHVLATLTTGGFYSADSTLWPIFPKLLLLTLMFVGGCISSSAGGIKIFRFIILVKMIKRGIGVRLHPNAVLDIKVGKQKVSSEVIQSVTGFLFLHIALTLTATAVITLSGLDGVSSFVTAAACINNVGPGIALSGTIVNYDVLPDALHLFLCFIMLAGRLELTTVVIIFSKHFWNPNRSR